MKTTVELPDALATQAKMLAHEQGTTLRDLLTEGLRAELQRREASTQPRPFRFLTVGAKGRGSSIDPRHFTALAYDLPAEDPAAGAA